MAMAKINISIPDGLLDEVDEAATWLKRSRSSLIQEAAAAYVAQLREERAAAERDADITSARRGIRELARDWNPSTARQPCAPIVTATGGKRVRSERPAACR